MIAEARDGRADAGTSSLRARLSTLPTLYQWGAGLASETCSACGKRVYAMERLEVDKRILHKNCFRCSKCNCVLR